MPLTNKSGRRQSLKGKRSRAKRSKSKRSKSKRSKSKRSKSKRRTHRKRGSNKKKRGAHHKRRRHTRSMRGRRGSMHGGSASALLPSPWIPSDVTNVYRTGVGGIMNASNAVNGMDSDPSPLPYKGQLVDDGNMVGEILRMA
tara:strand:- start:2282 stop:2707 length:426 start_codon:yes stop_codon:yes gene_type:complete